MLGPKRSRENERIEDDGEAWGAASPSPSPLRVLSPITHAGRCDVCQLEPATVREGVVDLCGRCAGAGMALTAGELLAEHGIGY